MMYTMTYASPSGETFDFMSDYAFFSDECDLRDWELTYDISGGEVTDLYIDLSKHSVPVYVTDVDARKRMSRILWRDAKERTPGTLTLDGWEIHCYGVASKKVTRWVTPHLMEIDLGLLYTEEEWTKAVDYEFFPDNTVRTGLLNFPHNLPTNVGCGRTTKSVNLNAISSSDFRLTIFGPARNPYVTVGKNTYQVNCALETGDYLVIDSRYDLVEVHKNQGDIQNVYGKRLKGLIGSGSYIFEQIKPGNNEISWDNTFGFTLRLYYSSPEPEDWGEDGGL